MAAWGPWDVIVLFGHFNVNTTHHLLQMRPCPTMSNKHPHKYIINTRKYQGHRDTKTYRCKRDALRLDTGARWIICDYHTSVLVLSIHQAFWPEPIAHAADEPSPFLTAVRKRCHNSVQVRSAIAYANRMCSVSQALWVYWCLSVEPFRMLVEQRWRSLIACVVFLVSTLLGPQGHWRWRRFCCGDCFL